MVGELRSFKAYGAAKKKKKRARRILSINPTSIFVNFKLVSNYSSQVRIIYQIGTKFLLAKNYFNPSSY